MAASYDLEGRVAIVTGGANGMGEMHCRLLAERGASVIIADIDERAEELAADIRAANRDAVFQRLNVSEEAEWQQLVDAIVAKHGKIDVLVNNAGLASIAPTNEATVEDFHRLFNVNVLGVFLGCKMVFQGMRAAGGGSIINISSAAGLKAALPGMSIYGATKGAVRLMTKTVAVDYAQYKIRCNSVHPGLIVTPLSAPYINDPVLGKTMLGTTLFDRPGERSEVSEVVAFLASDASSYMTGAELAVDGGWTAN